MTEDRARKVETLLRTAGRPGHAAPVSPDFPSGRWAIFDGQRDITADALEYLAAQGQTPAVRGFVVPAR